ncbi:MAG: TOBE domain-containing protein, partial [Clostridia bacterium]|nr:TOBE domain-containing protein [Clostridia bacterium]
DDPEFVNMHPEGVLEANVEVTELMGAEIYLYVSVDGIPFTARVAPTSTAQPGDTVYIALDVTKIHLFDKETEQTITN